MKINYDTIADALYLSIRKGKVSKSIKTEAHIIVDVDSKGNVLGIEVLEASKQLKSSGVKDLQRRVKEGIPINITSETPAVV